MCITSVAYTGIAILIALSCCLYIFCKPGGNIRVKRWSAIAIAALVNCVGIIVLNHVRQMVLSLERYAKKHLVSKVFYYGASDGI